MHEARRIRVVLPPPDGTVLTEDAVVELVGTTVTLRASPWVAGHDGAHPVPVATGMGVVEAARLLDDGRIELEIAEVCEPRALSATRERPPPKAPRRGR